MDFLDFQKLGLDNGDITRDDLSVYERNTAILTFERRNLVAYAEYRGKPVDTETVDIITGLGTWICEVTPSRNGYMAKGVRKLDASFFLELKASQRQSVIDALWESNREQIMQYMDEKYAEENRARIDTAVSEAVKPYQEEIAQLREEKEVLRRDLELARVQLGARPAVQIVQAEVRKDTEIATVPVVRRISPNLLECPMFDSPRYYVHISYDRSRMFIQPHETGKVACIEGKLILSGLENLVPYERECELRSEYVPGKGFNVYFD